MKVDLMKIRKFWQLLSCVVMLALPLGAGAQTIDEGALGKKIVLHLDVELTHKQQRRLDRFLKKADYYGALAANVTDLRDNAFGAAWNYNSLKAATHVAMASCRYKAKDPSDCVLLATVVPENRSKLPREAQMLSHSALRGFGQMQYDQLDNTQSYYALASSPLGTWEGFRSEISLADAKRQALTACNERAGKRWQNKPKEWVAAVGKPEFSVCTLRATLLPR